VDQIANRPWHRPELTEALRRGQHQLLAMFAGTGRRCPAGHALIEPGQPHNLVYRLARGWAARARTTPDARTQFILVFLPGDIFSVKSMFMPAQPDGMLTLSDAVVEQIDQRTLRDACARDPDIALRCTWQIVEEERRLHNWIVSLGRGSAEERLAHLLVEFHTRLIDAGVVAPDALTFDLPLTQVQLGDHLGVTPIHVNRVLRSLREQNIASIRDRRATIHDRAALYGLAAPLLETSHEQAPLAPS
jgi:CRP/FNR family transcriptional regulator, anaerobic regulatory protein